MKDVHEITQGDKVVYIDSDGAELSATVEHAETISVARYPVLVLAVTDHRMNPVRFKTVRNVRCGLIPGTWRLPDET